MIRAVHNAALPAVLNRRFRGLLPSAASGGGGGVDSAATVYSHDFATTSASSAEFEIDNEHQGWLVCRGMTGSGKIQIHDGTAWVTTGGYHRTSVSNVASGVREAVDGIRIIGNDVFELRGLRLSTTPVVISGAAGLFRRILGTTVGEKVATKIRVIKDSGDWSAGKVYFVATRKTETLIASHDFGATPQPAIEFALTNYPWIYVVSDQLTTGAQYGPLFISSDGGSNYDALSDVNAGTWWQHQDNSEKTTAAGNPLLWGGTSTTAAHFFIDLFGHQQATARTFCDFVSVSGSTLVRVGMMSTADAEVHDYAKIGSNDDATDLTAGKIYIVGMDVTETLTVNDFDAAAAQTSSEIATDNNVIRTLFASHDIDIPMGVAGIHLHDGTDYSSGTDVKLMQFNNAGVVEQDNLAVIPWSSNQTNRQFVASIGPLNAAAPGMSLTVGTIPEATTGAFFSYADGPHTKLQMQHTTANFGGVLYALTYE